MLILTILQGGFQLPPCRPAPTQNAGLQQRSRAGQAQAGAAKTVVKDTEDLGQCSGVCVSGAAAGERDVCPHG